MVVRVASWEARQAEMVAEWVARAEQAAQAVLWAAWAAPMEVQAAWVPRELQEVALEVQEDCFEVMIRRQI